MLRSSTEDSLFNPEIEELETAPVEEIPGEPPSASGIEDDVNGFAEPPVTSTD